MTATASTFALGRYRLSISLDHAGRVRETWSPRPPVRLTPAELKLYNRAKAAWAAPVMVAIPRGTPTRINVNGKRVSVAEVRR